MSESDDSLASLGDRLRQVRIEIFGDDGIDELAEQLGMAPQTWRNFEAIGELISAAQLHEFVELTGTHPLWLLRGQGPKYRAGSSRHEDPPASG
ncbi:MAG: hypothetical protein P4L84_35955 [Isosphaeraceae bacterium]|nr:hypothetical protein [Isosphaeraceae bacterium]